MSQKEPTSTPEEIFTEISRALSAKAEKAFEYVGK